MEIKAQEVAETLKVIANPNRLLILCFLEDRVASVGETSKYLPAISLPALSQHLSSLKLAGMIKSEKQGLNVIYSVSDQRIMQVIKVLKELYC